VANGVYQNTVFGMAAKLPFKYTGAVVLGTVSINDAESKLCNFEVSY
jgi:equilibrative nucleoside transporter 1/2/3